jgi:alpha-tubulin suppressor-like RCC1 family protein
MSSGSTNTLATKTDGTLWSWGRDDRGQLGLNSQNINRSSPTQVGTGTNWSQFGISVGENTSMATKTDGTLWLWGINQYGQLGQNSREALNVANRSSPIQLGAGTDWNRVSFGKNWAMATKTGGTLWTWGQNPGGNLGVNISYQTMRSSPVQVGGTTWNIISAGNYSSAATKTDGTLWTWGENNQGQLGLGNTVSRSSPVQVGVASGWTRVVVGQNIALAIRT